MLNCKYKLFAKNNLNYQIIIYHHYFLMFYGTIDFFSFISYTFYSPFSLYSDGNIFNVLLCFFDSSGISDLPSLSKKLFISLILVWDSIPYSRISTTPSPISQLGTTIHKGSNTYLWKSREYVRITSIIKGHNKLTTVLMLTKRSF